MANKQELQDAINEINEVLKSTGIGSGRWVTNDDVKAQILEHYLNKKTPWEKLVPAVQLFALFTTILIGGGGWVTVTETRKEQEKVDEAQKALEKTQEALGERQKGIDERQDALDARDLYGTVNTIRGLCPGYIGALPVGKMYDDLWNDYLRCFNEDMPTFSPPLPLEVLWGRICKVHVLCDDKLMKAAQQTSYFELPDDSSRSVQP
jgi:hypothetical protein